MPSQKNVESLEELKETLASINFLISTSFSGLNVAAMTEFRRKLQSQGLEYRVVKNTLASLAADEIGAPQIKQLLTGPTGLVMGKGDAAEAAKLLTEHIRSTRITMPVNGAMVEGHVLSAQDVTTLASLPPRPVLVASLMGQLVGLTARLVRTLNNPQQRMVYALNGPVQGLATVLQRSAEKDS